MQPSSRISACGQKLLLLQLACTVWAEKAVTPGGLECPDCARRSLECAAACNRALGALEKANIHKDFLRRLLVNTARACAASAAECHAHGGGDPHLRVCLELCLRCEEQCHLLLEELLSTVDSEDTSPEAPGHLRENSGIFTMSGEQPPMVFPSLKGLPRRETTFGQ